MSDRTVVERELYIEASPETVYRYWTDPDRLVLWMGISTMLEATPDKRLRWRMSSGPVVIVEYVESVPHSRLVFTWGFEGGPVPAGSTTVEVTLTEEGSGTRLRLVHRDLPAPAREEHERGWAHYLERLAVRATGGDPGPDPWAMQPAAN